MGWLIFIMVLIIHWNARSLVANGQEFKQVIEEMLQKPDVICIQETWLRPNLDFLIQGYVGVHRDRSTGGGGGCATFIKLGLPYRTLGLGKVGVCSGGGVGRNGKFSDNPFLQSM